MMYDRISHEANGLSSACEPILRSLPKWFGIEEATQHYIDHIENNLTFVAYLQGEVVGFLSIARHFEQSAEIYVMGVHPNYHRRGIGKALTLAAEEYLRDQGVRFFQVKTLSDQHPSPEYARTRAFYLSMGFLPLETFPDLWGKHNPCLQLIKAL